jgi:hypothetical protein
MNKLFFLTFLAGFVTYLNLQNDDLFFNRVLSDYSRHSNYISLYIKNRNLKDSVIVENADLFNILLEKRVIRNKTEYIGHLKVILNNDKIFQLDSFKNYKRYFQPVLTIKHLQDIASNGEDYFVKYYFKGNILDTGVTLAEKNAIIYQLFKWRISEKIDDESGLLVIVNSS